VTSTRAPNSQHTGGAYMEVLRCSSCGTTIIIDPALPLICGKCGASLELTQPIQKTASAKLNRRRSFRWIMTLTVIALVAGVSLRFPNTAISVIDAISVSTRTFRWTDIAFVLGGIAVTGLFALLIRRGRWTSAQLGGNGLPSAPRGSNAKEKLDMLARRAWGGPSDIVGRSLAINSDRIANLSAHSDIVKEMLAHVRRVAPALTVPMMTPRIVVEPLTDAAGQFVDDDGWVKIVVGAVFFEDRPVAVSILCHELCHYVLEANGIRELPTSENERNTDLAMFVFGLGDLFLAGYRTAPATRYRAGHRLGYLTDREFLFANAYTSWLRTSDDFLRSTKERPDDWRWDRSLR
jgi:hypothetical protein